MSLGGVSKTQASITQSKRNRNDKSFSPERHNESNIFTPEAPKEESMKGNPKKLLKKLV